MSISSRITCRSASRSAARDRRVLEHVGQVVDRHLEVPVEHPRVVARVLLGGERVEVAADRVELLGDVAGRTLVGSLEQQVLEEVAVPADRGALVTRAGEHPDAERDGADAGHPLGHDTQAGGELGARRSASRLSSSLAGVAAALAVAEAASPCRGRRLPRVARSRSRSATLAARRATATVAARWRPRCLPAPPTRRRRASG